MKSCLIIKFECFWLALSDVLQVDIKDLAEPWPQNINRYLLKYIIQHIYPIHFLHLFLALLVNLDHNKHRVNIPKRSFCMLFKLVYKVLANNLLEDLVEHKGLLGLIAGFEVKELQDEEKLFGNSVRDQFHLAPEYFFTCELLHIVV